MEPFRYQHSMSIATSVIHYQCYWCPNDYFPETVVKLILQMSLENSWFGGRDRSPIWSYTDVFCFWFDVVAGGYFCSVAAQLSCIFKSYTDKILSCVFNLNFNLNRKWSPAHYFSLRWSLRNDFCSLRTKHILCAYKINIWQCYRCLVS